jgi:hypothetical protein
LPLKGLLSQSPLIIYNLTYAIQLPYQLLKKDVPYGKIIETLLTTQPLKMLPGFPVPIPGIVFLTAGRIFPAVFNSYNLKMAIENPPVILDEGFKHAGFCEILLCPVCGSLFGRWQWHLFDFVLGI